MPTTTKAGCRNCGKPLRLKYANDPAWLKTINPERRLGPYFDGFFCSLTCGHRFAVKSLTQAGSIPSTAPER